ncbi:hypothetical protein ACFE04_026126 [Oxalis oulophora]
MVSSSSTPKVVAENLNFHFCGKWVFSRSRVLRGTIIEISNVAGPDSSVKKWGFKIHIGGTLIHEPTLEYVGGESYDKDVSPIGFNLDVLEDVIESLDPDLFGKKTEYFEKAMADMKRDIKEYELLDTDSDVDGNDNVAGAVHEEELAVQDEPMVVHDEPVVLHDEAGAVHDEEVAVHNLDSDVAVTDVGENDVAVTDVRENDVAMTDMGENDVAATDVPENDVAVTDVPDNDGSDVDSDGSEDNWSDVAGSDGGTDRGSDVDDVSVDGISFCSDREDEELVSLMTQANNFTETAATHGPEKDAIRQNRRVTNASNSDDEYEVGADYMEDSNLNWSLTEDEDVVAKNNGEGEVNSAQVEMDEDEIPHTGEHLRVDSVSRNNKRLEKAEKWMSQITPRILDIYDHYSEASRSCMVLFGVRNGWEIQEGEDTYVVRTEAGECSCRVWDLQGIPCKHAIPILARKGKNPETYISQWYNTELYKELYRHQINPMASEKFWKSTNTQPLVPPPPRKKLGRPKEKRIPEAGEGGTSTKASRKGRRMRCNLCKVIGHNKRTCPLKGDEEALAASVAAYYASIVRNVPVQASTGPSAPPIAEGVPEAGPSVPSSTIPKQPKRKKVKLTIGLSKPVSTVPVVAVPTVPVKATTVPDQATTVPDVPVVAPFMRGPKLVKKRKAGDVLGQTSKKPWK